MDPRNLKRILPKICQKVVQNTSVLDSYKASEKIISIQ